MRPLVELLCIHVCLIKNVEYCNYEGNRVVPGIGSDRGIVSYHMTGNAVSDVIITR